MQCHYCKRFEREATLEYLPNKKSYYCKLCGYSWSEDTINAEQPKAGGFPLTVVKEELIDDPNESSKEDKTGLRVGGIPKGALDKYKKSKK